MKQFATNCILMILGPIYTKHRKAVIEATSTFYRSFTEFFLAMHEFFDETSMIAILN